jgi:hypothetical protein
MDEELLTGGNKTSTVTRVDGTVRRSRSARATSSASVLKFLESVNFPYAPRYRGVDDQGRDILTFVAGETTGHPSQRAAGATPQPGRCCGPCTTPRRHTPGLRGADCVVHGDPGPFNTICRQGLPVAFIDWDSSGPGQRLDDLGYLAWTWCIQSEGSVPITEQARHLRELRGGYGQIDSGDLIHAILRQQTLIETVESANKTRASLSPGRRQHAERAVAWAVTDRSLLQQHLRSFTDALEYRRPCSHGQGGQHRPRPRSE